MTLAIDCHDFSTSFSGPTPFARISHTTKVSSGLIMFIMYKRIAFCVRIFD